MLRTKLAATIILLFLISACSENLDFSTPAQDHINDYRTELKQRRAKQSGQSTQDGTSTADHNASNDQDSKASNEEINASQVTSQKAIQENEHSTMLSQQNNTQGIFEIQEYDIILGDKNSAIVVIEYAGATCAHCAYFHKAIFPELKKNYIDTKKIAYVIRQFIANKQDLDAAALSLCNGSTEYFMKMLDVLYQQQQNWAFNTNYRDILTNLGQLAGLSPERYAECLNNEQLIGALINKSRAIGHVHGFIGTPSFVINGKLSSKAYTYKNLSDAIEDEIKKSSIASPSLKGQK